MGDPITFFAAASFLVSAVGAKSQASAAASQARAQADQARLQIAEFDRQQDEVEAIAAEKKSDRVRAADKEIGSIVASLSEVGALGTVNELRFVQEAGFLEGLDVARIESNRRREVAGLEASKEAAAGGARASIGLAKTRTQAAAIQFLGSGLSIGADAFQKKQQLKLAKDKT